MRKTIVLLVAFTAATALAGGIQVSPSSVTMQIGDVFILNAVNAPGGLSSGFRYDVTFYSDDPTIATVTGFASGSGYAAPYPIPDNGNVYVTAISPGIAHVRAKTCCGDLATVIVRPQPVLSVQPDEVIATRGKPVTLLATMTDPVWYVTFEWFRGHIGDESRPLQTSASQLLVFMPEPGTNTVWVRASAVKWQGTAEAKVTVPVVRRRASR